MFKSLTNNLKYDSNRTANVIVNEIRTKYRNGDYIVSSLVEVKLDNMVVEILFNFLEDEDLKEDQFYIAPETEKTFFVNEKQLGIIDLRKCQLIELKEAWRLGFIEKIRNSIIFDDELSVKSYSLEGKLIDEKPIDPPTEVKTFDDYIEYESPIFGKQKLKIQ